MNMPYVKTNKKTSGVTERRNNNEYAVKNM